jgi:tRNA modification GTPase
MSYYPDDTIAAIATAAGGAARGMVRVSGPDSLGISAGCFAPDDGQTLGQLRHPTAVPGRVFITLGETAPRHLPCDLLVWPTRRSYTRQPIAEFHTIGSPPLLEAVLATVCRAGARLAEPGEFTLRAFLAGRLDLTQAEAVLGVIDAQGTDTLNAALVQLAGGLARPLSALRDELLQLLAELEAGLDFADEDIQFISPEDLRQRLQAAGRLLSDVAEQMASRRAAADADQVVLLGEPNVGKSSLFNALAASRGSQPDAATAVCHEAIVSREPGTTRDYLTATIRLDGRRCELVDTAGIDEATLTRTLSQRERGACAMGGRGEAQRPPSETGGSLRSTPGTLCPPSDIGAAAQAMAAERRVRAAVRVLCVEASAIVREGHTLPPSELLKSLPLPVGEGRGEGSGTTANSASCDVVVLTKTDLVDGPIDLPGQLPGGVPVVAASSRTGQGLDQLCAVLCDLLSAESTAARGQVVAATADRCRESIRLAEAALVRATDVLADSGGEELVAVEVRDALHELGKVVGAVYTDDLLDRIFGTFCIGK